MKTGGHLIMTLVNGYKKGREVAISPPSLTHPAFLQNTVFSLLKYRVSIIYFKY
jgi:hypothetical protein